MLSDLPDRHRVTAAVARAPQPTTPACHPAPIKPRAPDTIARVTRQIRPRPSPHLESHHLSQTAHRFPTKTHAPSRPAHPTRSRFSEGALSPHPYRGRPTRSGRSLLAAAATLFDLDPLGRRLRLRGSASRDGRCGRNARGGGASR
eukprot:1035507-Prymnesium_polylepis.2